MWPTTKCSRVSSWNSATARSSRRVTVPTPPRGAPPTDYFWSVHWEIPADYPTGSLGYKVSATKMDDTTQTWEPFTRAPSQLTVIAGEPEMKN